MKLYNHFSLLAVAFMIAAIISCTPAEVPGFVTEDNMIRVPVNLNLSIGALDNGTPGTKGIMEPEADASTENEQIANILVLQFNGVRDTAKLVGGQNYIDHWPLRSTLDPSDPNYNESDILTLVASNDPTTVVVLANTFAPISINNRTTLAEFLSQDYTSIYSLSEVFTPVTYSTGSGDLTDYYLRMSGSAYVSDVGLSSTTDISITLKRNVSKVVLNIKNNTHINGNTGDDIVNISSVELKDINGKYYYLTHIAPELTASDANLTFKDLYEASTPHRFGYEEPFDNVGNTTGATQTITLYMPANCRGTTTNQYQHTKAYGAPAGSTKLYLHGTYGSENTPVVYSYYLGGNLENDFNLLPNHKYTYNININKKGDPRFDARVEDMGEYTFTTDANCYMLQPPIAAGLSRTYSFPVRRAAVFWNAPGVNKGVYGGCTMVDADSDYSGFAIDGTTHWNAVILWSDFNMTDYLDGPNKFLQVSSGTGFDPANPLSQPYIKVKVSSGMKGNVVVGMQVSGTILWSWHLWITDYYPDVNMSVTPGVYKYSVTNGEIHHYKGTSTSCWRKSPTATAMGYVNGFAMDRNLGAISARWDGTGSAGCTYQFGRKDPFLDIDQSNSYNYFYLNGTNHTNVVGTGNSPANRRISYGYYNTADENKNIRFTVYNPLVFISSGWTAIGDELGSGTSTKPWMDPMIWQHTGDNELLEPRKSIYDPCPAGWHVPPYDWLLDFQLESPSTTATQSFTVVRVSRGYEYYPEGYANASETGAIFFPTAAIRTTAGSIESGTSWYWSQTPDRSSTAQNGHYAVLTSSTIRPNEVNYGGINTMSRGMNVRCVRE